MEDKYRRTAVIKIETNIITNITTIQIVQAVIMLDLDSTNCDNA
jgi:hypothetical protein